MPEAIVHRISNLTRMEELLLDPNPELSLDQLATELNELAKLRQNSRLAFCKRLAVAYMVIVGHSIGAGSQKNNPKRVEFFQWIDKNIRSANGKRYTKPTILTYLTTGFAANPEAHMEKIKKAHIHRSEKLRRIASGLSTAIYKEGLPKTLPITRIKERYNVDTDVAWEVNQLMAAWEQASPAARSNFIYQVTGRRL